MHTCRLLFSLLIQGFFVRTLYAWFPDALPNYCSNNVADRAIPGLNSTQSSMVDSLVQVQVIIRHGARTPAHLHACWAGYNVTWNNCNVTQLMLASPSYNSPNRPSPWLFRKLYDASPNYLGGNCETGQLLLEGYLQQESNGELLYDAYLNKSNPALNLFPTSVWADINTGYDMYLRSDDEERTLLSGQVLMHSMFDVSEDVTVLWHTGDYDLDQLHANEDVCPYLDTLEDNIYDTAAWQTENSSYVVQTLTEDLNDIFGGEGQWSWAHVHDCMLTTVCTGRELPNGGGGSGGSGSDTRMTEEIFNATLAQTTLAKVFKYRYNDSQWSKIAQGNTAWHVRTNLQKVVDGDSTAIKFLLYSGHDTTVMPFLAALLQHHWDRQWSPYAALVSIEVYTASASSPVGTDNGGSGFYFRLVYDGVPQLVPGCGDVLCDVNILLEGLAFGQQFPAQCSISDDATASEGEQDCSSNYMSRAFWISMIFVTLVFGAASSAYITSHYRARGKLARSTAGVVISATSTTATIAAPPAAETPMVSTASATVLRDSECSGDTPIVATATPTNTTAATSRAVGAGSSV
mmetsp:Transcript_17391/g.29386  ORF Transcript_17391/g.29386 Transcript_17391/m.29386 type:complete len:575 (-) Transcript_17391:186-1910(-)